MKKNILQYILGGFLLLSSSLHAEIVINEVMPCNISTMYNKENYNFSGVIEFYNNGKESVSLKGMTLTHFKKKKSSEGTELKGKWEIDQDISVKGGKYTLLWMDESSAQNHAPFKLDADGGYITLYQGATLIDSIYYNAMEPHISYGRYGSDMGYMVPTLKEENSFCVSHKKNHRCIAPSLSQKPGIINETFKLSLSTRTDNAKIYYTTDGSEPSPSNGELYEEEITIEKNTNIRAIAYLDNMLPSKITTGSYIFMDKEHEGCGGFSLPIVSVTANEEFLENDTIGILVVGTNGIIGEKDCNSTKANYHQDWKRAVNFEYIKNDQYLSQEVEAAVEGGCSVGNKVKSLSLKTSKKTGNEVYDFDFFDSKPGLKHKTLHLRNGGNEFENIRFKDGLAQTFAIGMNIDYQGFQPVAYYLNGEYQGLMGLRERMNDDYIKTNHGYDDDEIDFITIGDQSGIVLKKGDLTFYNQLVEHLTQNEPDSEGYYQKACQMMDMDEYIDYQILQQYAVNVDWPGNNTKLWRAKDGGRFRWMLFDMDFGFKCLYNTYLCNLDRNMIEWSQGKGQTDWANKKSWMVEIFKNLSENPEFKTKFTTKFLSHLSTTFSTENIDKVFDDVCGKVSNEFCATFDGKDAFAKTKEMRNYAHDRASYVYDHLIKYVGGEELVDLEISSNVDDATILLNNEPISEYQGKYISKWNMNLKAYAPEGYRFVEWNFSPDSSCEVGKIASVSLLDNNSKWSYYYEATAPDRDWNTNDFDDSTWESGAGFFGYNTTKGDSKYDVVLDYGEDDEAKPITAYFRSTFEIQDVKNIRDLTADIDYDDGFVMYINGNEVKRENLPEEEISDTTLSVDKNGNDRSSSFSISPEYLTNGKNIIAVEVHQASAGSSDLEFNFSMKMTQQNETDDNGNGEINISLNGDLKVTAIFEKISNYPGYTLVLNEVSASSGDKSNNPDDYGKYPDWIEVYNYGEEPCDLAGLYLSVESNDSPKEESRIPFGYPETIIQPGEHKLLWAKGDLLDGPLYLGFNLDVDNPSLIKLFYQKENGETKILNEIKYENHEKNESYGRVEDNSNDLTIFSVKNCDDGQILITATPKASNGTIECEPEVTPEVTPEETPEGTPEETLSEDFNVLSHNLSPNPFSSDLTVTSSKTISSIQLMDLTGKTVFRQENINTTECTLHLATLEEGVYIIQIQTESEIIREKIIKRK